MGLWNRRTQQARAGYLTFAKRGLPDVFDSIVDPASELGQELAARWRADEEECAHILPQALKAGYHPQQLYDAVIREFGVEGTPLAIKARSRLWEAHLHLGDSGVAAIPSDGIHRRRLAHATLAYALGTVATTTVLGLEVVAGMVALALVAELAPR
jgi:hypothetical protein